MLVFLVVLTFLAAFLVWAFAVARENVRNGLIRRLDGGTVVITGDAGASRGGAIAGCNGAVKAHQ